MYVYAVMDGERDHGLYEDIPELDQIFTTRALAVEYQEFYRARQTYPQESFIEKVKVYAELEPEIMGRLTPPKRTPEDQLIPTPIEEADL
ncbi:MAG: hypothetical protein JRC93_03960 [Deltaproteobacteria bacterium]|nr:hypothetical protein [Deltaproteobacteria bacterium]